MSMPIGEIIRQLESLAEHCESMIDKDDPEDIWRIDTVALQEAVKKLKGEPRNHVRNLTSDSVFMRFLGLFP